MREPVAVFCTLAGVCFAGHALAEGRIALDRFEPAARPGVLPYLADAPSDHTVVSASALLETARAPLGERLLSGTDESTGESIVGAQTVLHLGLSLPLARALEGTVRLPVSLALEGASADTLGAGPGTAGLGDTEVGLRARVWGAPARPWIGAFGALSLPTTTGGPWTGAGTFAGTGGLSFGAPAGRLTLRLDVAARVREETTVANLIAGPEALLNAGVSLPVLPELELGVGLAMATGLGAEARFARSTTYVELGGAARYALFRRVRLLGGAGLGLTEGYGTPSARFFAGVDVSFGDPSRPPAPPLERRAPEPAPMFVLGARERSPRDTDGDGLLDPLDRCVEAPEDRDGVLDGDGCPEADPHASSVVLRVAEGELSPSAPAPLPAELDLGRVHFETDRAEIPAVFAPVVGDMAATLRAHPEIAVITIRGRADARGSDTHNGLLSQRRALAVAARLVELGVAPSRIRVVGDGEDQPERSELERAANRRAEVAIERRSPAP